MTSRGLPPSRRKWLKASAGTLPLVTMVITVPRLERCPQISSTLEKRARAGLTGKPGRGGADGSPVAGPPAVVPAAASFAEPAAVGAGLAAAGGEAATGDVPGAAATPSAGGLAGDDATPGAGCCDRIGDAASAAPSPSPDASSRGARAHSG